MMCHHDDVRSEMTRNTYEFESNEAQNADFSTTSVHVSYIIFLLRLVRLINDQLLCINIRPIGQPGQSVVFIDIIG